MENYFNLLSAPAEEEDVTDEVLADFLAINPDDIEPTPADQLDDRYNWSAGSATLDDTWKDAQALSAPTERRAV